MKKYLIFLVLLLCSFIYVPRETYALTSDYYSQFFYTEQTMANVEQNIDKINAIKQYIELNGFKGYNVGTGNYVLMFKPNTHLSTEDIYVYLLTPNHYHLYNYYRNNLGNFEFQYGYARTIYRYENGVVSISPNDTQTTGNSYMQISYIGYCNPTVNNCTGDKVDDYYFDTTYLSDSFTIPFENYNLSGVTQIPYKSDNIIYTPPINVPLKTILKSFKGITPKGICTNYERFGELVNVKDIQIFTPITSNALGEEYSGTIEINYTSDSIYSTSDFTVHVDTDIFNSSNVSSTVVGDYDFQCYNDKKVCLLHYSYTNMDDIDTDYTVYFDIILPSGVTKVNFNNCIYSGVYRNSYYSYNDSEFNNSDLINALNDTDLDIGILTQLQDYLPTGPFSEILTLPIKMIDSLSDSLSGTCRTFNITLPYVNKNISIPCISVFYTNIGASSFFNWVGIMCSSLILLNYFVFLYNWLNNVFRLNEKNLRVWGTTGKGGYY